MNNKTDNLTTGGEVLKSVQGFLAGVVAPSYKVKLIWKKQKVRYKVPGSLLPLWSGKDVIENLSYLVEYNQKDFDVYIRPDDPRFILLDDLRRDTLEAFAKLKPCLLMETSPGNYQAWLKLHSIPSNRNQQTIIWRTLATEFNADPYSAKPDQIGRLPGLYNRKEKYLPISPIVKLHNFSNRNSSWEFKPMAEPMPPPVVKIGKKESGRDRSSFDWAITCSLIEKGQNDELIKNYLLQKSDKARERGMRYIENTIRKARQKKG